MIKVFIVLNHKIIDRQWNENHNKYGISIKSGGFMKKLLSVLLLIFLLPLSACGGVKYEFKDGIMYEDGKEATGTFEFKIGKYKTKGNFVNGLAEGLFERYYPDGNVMIVDN